MIPLRLGFNGNYCITVAAKIPCNFFSSKIAFENAFSWSYFRKIMPMEELFRQIFFSLKNIAKIVTK
jgi:hypothetical protein